MMILPEFIHSTEGLNHILLKKRKTALGNNKNRPNSRVRCSIPPDRPLTEVCTVPRKFRRRYL